MQCPHTMYTSGPAAPIRWDASKEVATPYSVVMVKEFVERPAGFSLG